MKDIFESTKIKFIDNSNLMSLSLYECCACHWRFFGDVVRFGHEGFDSQSQEIPNFCPMCGREIEEISNEDERRNV
jgi:rubrerythrin